MLFRGKKDTSESQTKQPDAAKASSSAPGANTKLGPGSTGSEVKTASLDEAKRRARNSARRSISLTQIISILVRSPQHKYLALADLEWLVFPPLRTGQFSIAEVKAKDGQVAPAAVVLWATVSPEVDKKLSENLAAPIKLSPNEWKSGSIHWLIEVAGDARVASALLRQLQDTTFRGRQVKVRTRDEKGKPAVQALQQVIASRANAQPSNKPVIPAIQASGDRMN